MWLSLVERCVRDAKAAGSNPVTSTIHKRNTTHTVDGISFIVKSCEICAGCARSANLDSRGRNDRRSGAHST